MELLLSSSSRKKKRHDTTAVKKIDQDLFNAAYFGDEQKVYRYIKEGGDVNYMEERDGWLGLHYAARWGNNKMAMMYLQNGADVNGRTKDKETPLHKAARWDCKETAILLLRSGANPLLKNSDGNKASDMSADPEMKFLLDNFKEYKQIQASQGIDIGSPSVSKRKSIDSPVKRYIKGDAGISNGKISNLPKSTGTSFFDMMPKKAAINYENMISNNNSTNQSYRGSSESKNMSNGWQQQSSPSPSPSNTNMYQNGFSQSSPSNTNMYQNGFSQPPNTNMYQNGFSQASNMNGFTPQLATAYKY